MKKLIVLASVLLAATPAFAGQTAYAVPQTLISSVNGVVLFNMNGGRTDAPSCATIPNRFAISTNTDPGRVTIATLLTAHARGKRIFVYGTGNCGVWGDSESVDYIQIED